MLRHDTCGIGRLRLDPDGAKGRNARKRQDTRETFAPKHLENQAILPISMLATGKVLAMSDTRKVKYFLAVSAPDSTDDWLFQAESDTPFGAMNEGDLFHVGHVEGFAASNVSGRIGRIEHSFYGTNETTLVQQRRVFLLKDDWHENGIIHRTNKIN